MCANKQTNKQHKQTTQTTQTKQTNKQHKQTNTNKQTNNTNKQITMSGKDKKWLSELKLDDKEYFDLLSSMIAHSQKWVEGRAVASMSWIGFGLDLDWIWIGFGLDWIGFALDLDWIGNSHQYHMFPR